MCLLSYANTREQYIYSGGFLSSQLTKYKTVQIVFVINHIFFSLLDASQLQLHCFLLNILLSMSSTVYSSHTTADKNYRPGVAPSKRHFLIIFRLKLIYTFSSSSSSSLDIIPNSSVIIVLLAPCVVPLAIFYSRSVLLLIFFSPSFFFFSP